MLTPDPPSSLGNPPPPFTETLALPDAPPLREGRVVPAVPGSAGVDLRACRKILVVKLDFIGDFVLTTPFLGGLRRAAPDAEITLVVLDRVFDLAAPCGLVDRVVAVPAAGGGPGRVGAMTRDDLSAFLRDVRGAAFDLVLVPRWDTDFNGATRIAGLCGASRVVGFSERCTERKAVENAGFDRYLSVAVLDTRECHEVEHTLGMLDALGAARETRLRLDLTDADRHSAADFRHASFGDPSPPLLAVAPFAAGRRQWPLDRTVDLAARVARRYGMAVVVVGGPDTSAGANQAVAGMRALGVDAATSADVLLFRGNAALIGQSALFIGMDSGPGHIAAALGVPVAIVGVHPDGASRGHPAAPERFGPWGDPARVLVLRPPGHSDPCRDGCEADEPHCILGITVDDAFAATAAFAEAVLSDNP